MCVCVDVPLVESGHTYHTRYLKFWKSVGYECDYLKTFFLILYIKIFVELLTSVLFSILRLICSLEVKKQNKDKGRFFMQLLNLKKTDKIYFCQKVTKFVPPAHRAFVRYKK